MDYDNVGIGEYRKQASKGTAAAIFENQCKRTALLTWKMSHSDPDYAPLPVMQGSCLFDILEEEYVFDEKTDRKWRFDYAVPHLKIAFEVEGLVMGVNHGSGKSRHTTNSGYTGDCLKYSSAAAQGWLVIRATEPLIRSGVALQLFIEAMRLRMGSGAL